MSSKPVRALIPFLASLAAAAAAPVHSQAHSQSQGGLADLDLEALMDMEVNVTSVAKKSARLAESAAAVTVITRDDLRRLGFTRLPEALRTVPGVNVARINGNGWAISARGFNQQYANKLLVLIDGRSVFTPSFGGVYWDVQDLLIEDIERIEVIRGPGATLWGSNAVNGVINITTRLARDTQGGLLTTTAGNEPEQVVGIRYGGELGADAHYRAYAKFSNSDGLLSTDEIDSSDGSRSYRAGFRADWDRRDDESLTIQGDGYIAEQEERIALPLYTAPFSEFFEDDPKQSGANLLARWTRTPSSTSHTQLQAYVEHSRHETWLTIEKRDTFDIEWEHRFRAGGSHDILWGMGYSLSKDDFNESPLVSWSPSSRTLNLFKMFAQDEVALVPERLSMTFGSKFEHNDYTGFEVQPSVTLRWSPRERHTLWTSVSRAVSTPTRLSRDTRITYGTFQPAPLGPVAELVATGNSEIGSERVIAYEMGYRFETTANLSFDLATFNNRHKGVTAATPSLEYLVMTPVPHVVVERQWANDANGYTHGAEVAMQWQPLGVWRMTAAYSYLSVHLHGAGGAYEAGSPSQQASLRSYLNLPHDLQLNTAAYYVDQVESIIGAGITTIPAYVRLDTGITWTAYPSLQLGIWGQNLLDDRHTEFTRLQSSAVTDVPRTFLIRANWQF